MRVVTSMTKRDVITSVVRACGLRGTQDATWDLQTLWFASLLRTFFAQYGCL